MQKTDTAEMRRLWAKAEAVGGDGRDLAIAMNTVYLALPALLDELEAARKENDFLRLRLAESDKDCVYCNLPASEMPKCSSGFPGCARADDLYSCDELSRRDDRMKLIGAAEELEEVAKLDWFAFTNVTPSATADMMLRRAAQLRQEAEDGRND